MSMKARFTGWKNLFIPVHIPGHWVAIYATRTYEDGPITLQVLNPSNDVNGGLAAKVLAVAESLRGKSKCSIKYMNDVAQQPDGTSCGPYIVVYYYFIIVYERVPTERDFTGYHLPSSKDHIACMRAIRYFMTHLLLTRKVVDAKQHERKQQPFEGIDLVALEAQEEAAEAAAAAKRARAQVKFGAILDGQAERVETGEEPEDVELV